MGSALMTNFIKANARCIKYTRKGYSGMLFYLERFDDGCIITEENGYAVAEEISKLCWRIARQP